MEICGQLLERQESFGGKNRAQVGVDEVDPAFGVTQQRGQVSDVELADQDVRRGQAGMREDGRHPSVRRVQVHAIPIRQLAAAA
jgi:hypothetical protein